MKIGRFSSFRSSSPLFNGGEKRKMTEEPQGAPSKKAKKESEESDVSSSSSEDEDDDDDEDTDKRRCDLRYRGNAH